MTIESDQSLKARLADANINPESFLATDYLNHFNEIVMLMEMLPDMPDMLEEALEWQPKGYQGHFRDSSFQAKDLAIEAYDMAPKSIRDIFETIIGQLDQTILSTLNGLKNVGANERGLSGPAQQLLGIRITAIQDMLMKLNQVIHAKHDQSVVDEVANIMGQMSGAAPDVSTADISDAQTQADIDKLFD